MIRTPNPWEPIRITQAPRTIQPIRRVEEPLLPFSAACRRAERKVNRILAGTIMFLVVLAAYSFSRGMGLLGG